MAHHGLLVGLVALAAAVVLTNAAQAQKTTLKPIKEWMGSVEDEKLAKDAPSVITNKKDLEKLWKDWNIADKLPDVDFTKELVAVTTSRGSKLSLIASLDDKGDLQVLGLGTRDLRPGFRYVIATISRQGVKTVGGKELR